MLVELRVVELLRVELPRLPAALKPFRGIDGSFQCFAHSPLLSVQRQRRDNTSRYLYLPPWCCIEPTPSGLVAVKVQRDSVCRQSSGVGQDREWWFVAVAAAGHAEHICWYYLSYEGLE